VTTETVPRPGETREMAYYWDSSHFKEQVGDWILDRLFDVEQKIDGPPDDFGTLLDSSTIEGELEKIRKAQRNYRIQFPNDVALIQASISEKRNSIRGAHSAL